MERITVVSADGHVGCPLENYRSYIDADYRDGIDDLAEEQRRTLASSKILQDELLIGVPEEMLDAVDERGRRRSGEGVDLYWNRDKRLAELDDEGIAAEVVIAGSDYSHPFFSASNRVYPPDVRFAGARAFNRWVAEMASGTNGRLLPNAEPGPCLDMDATVAELRWAAEHGFVAVTAPGSVADPDLPPMFSPHFEPFWAACADLGLALTIHAGWGLPQGVIFEFMQMLIDGFRIEEGMFDASPFALEMGPRRTVWQLMLAGVFDRHPALKVVLTEVRADWLPATLGYLDEQFAQHATELKLKPSEYFARNCGVTPSSPHQAEVEIRHQIGIDQMMFGADIPHPESTWPNTRQWIRHAFAGVPEGEVRKLLGENAIRIYGLDGSQLAGIAAGIGPTVPEVFAGVDLQEPVLANFHSRAGYRKPVERVKTADIESHLTPDFADANAAAGG